ncbi:MAG TPA: YceI family protein [Puia sp.]|nr:YceI family protein [Puia sp.]
MKAILIALMPVVFMGAFLASNWKADPAKAKVGFSVKGPFGTVHGNFTGLKSTIRFDEHDLAGSAVEASIDPKTVSTGIGMRNHHVREEEQYLNAEKYPEISFHSKKIVKTGDGFSAAGELTLKGISKPVQIPFTFNPNGGNAGLFKGEFSFKRQDFNIGKPGGSVGDVITISLEVPVTK